MDETSATFPPSNTEDEGSFYCRQAFAKLDMKIQEGFFLSHPALPDDVKTILKPLACIPVSLKSEYPELNGLPETFFYENVPEYLHVHQVKAAGYLLTQRAEEMYRLSIQGKTKDVWASVTQKTVFIPLLDPTSSMNLMLGQSTLEYPMSMGKVAAELTVPKPDICFFSHMNLSSLQGDLMPAWTPSIFSLDDEQLFSRLSWREGEEICCGAGSEGFCCPTFVVERTSDSGSQFLAQNQFFSSLRCIVEAQSILKERINNELPVLPMGLVNVGNWVEFWAGWVNSAGKIQTVHVNDYHLFKAKDCVEFVSLMVRIHQWIQRYQTALIHGLDNPPPVISSDPSDPSPLRFMESPPPPSSHKRDTLDSSRDQREAKRQTRDSHLDDSFQQDSSNVSLISIAAESHDKSQSRIRFAEYISSSHVEMVEDEMVDASDWTDSGSSDHVSNDGSASVLPT